MSLISLTLRDLIWLASLLITVALAYARLHSELRHLEDVKASRHEVNTIVTELRSSLSQILSTLARLEENLRQQSRRQL
ncbi:hypothetical protein K8I28_16000 [bacterium]|nr:hypothetical protein [bacterium]